VELIGVNFSLRTKALATTLLGKSLTKNRREETMTNRRFFLLALKPLEKV
jgi:hypothetical protein